MTACYPRGVDARAGSRREVVAAATGGSVLLHAGKKSLRRLVLEG
jgi:hypothetical protein